MVEKTKRHIENYKKQDIFADATQAREGIETDTLAAEACIALMQLKPVRALKREITIGSHTIYRCNSSP